MDTYIITVVVHVFFFGGRHWGAVVNLTDWWAAPILLYSEGYPLVERGAKRVLHQRMSMVPESPCLPYQREPVSCLFGL